MLNLPLVRHRSFSGNDAGSEHFIAISPSDSADDFSGQLDSIIRQYESLQSELGLTHKSAVFHRLFLSDAANQQHMVQASPLNDRSVAVSIIQQPPLPRAKIALLAYHVEGATPIEKRRLSPEHLLVEKAGSRHLWSTQICCGDMERHNAAGAQTLLAFENLIDALERQGGRLSDHCQRTWIYLRDVDVFYADMVDSRRLLFERHGLTGRTHYIASTGIEGACAHQHDLFTMDAYSNLDLNSGQVSYLNDFSQLCATKDYNVTFERGTRIAYADRTHLLISGTASIDYTGAVIHPGNVLRQAERALENVAALLRSGGADLTDMMYLIVYLRDSSDFNMIASLFRERLPDTPVTIVQGAVCRPAWLVEVEGVAVVRNDQPNLPSF